MDDPKQIVERGYDAMAARYAAWARDEVEGAPNVEWLEKLLALLPPYGDVLELGCGSGEPAARMLAARHRYTGVDLSREQLRLARAVVPDARLLHADLATLDFDPESFDAVVSLYVLGHLPQEDVPRVYASVARWLRPGGYFLCTTGRRDEPGIVEDFLGVPMFFSGLDRETNLRLIDEAGMDVLEAELITQIEPDEGTPTFLWVLARKRH